MSQDERLTRLVAQDLDQSIALIDRLLPDNLKRSLKDSPHSVPQEALPLRPFLVLLSARRYGLKGERPVRLAGALQMIHYASILHDRLGEFNVALKRDDPCTMKDHLESMDILLGDFLFTMASALVVEEGKEDIIEDMIQTSLASAEIQARLLGLDKEGTIDDIDAHFSVVSGKLSLFLSLSCRVGSLLCGAPGEERNLLSLYGQSLGRAIRIAEDLRFWDGYSQEPGLPQIDPRLTYPVLLYRKEGAHGVCQGACPQGASDGQHVQTLSLRDTLASKGYLERSCEAARHYVDEACRNLDPLPFSEEIPVLKGIAQRYVA